MSAADARAWAVSPRATPLAPMTGAPVLIRVHGMRRSGNHAVIGWLRRNMPGGSVFLNDCGPGDPYASFRSMESPRGDRHGPSFRDTRWYAQFERGRAGFSHVVSYEDQAPGAPPSGWAAPWRTLIVHRGFLGWLASYYALVVHRQGGTPWGVDRPEQVEPMIERYAALLRAAREAPEVGLEHWCTDAAYRAARLAALGLPVRDDTTGGQADYGGGSSFAPGPEAPEARDLARRWVGLAADPQFERLTLRAAQDDAFICALADLYPEDAALLARLASGGRLRDERG